MFAKLIEKAKGWLVDTAWAWLLVAGASVTAGLPYFTQSWVFAGVVACIAGLLALIGFALGGGRPRPSIPDQTERVASSAPATALRVIGRTVVFRADGQITVKLLILNELATAPVTVTNVVLIPSITGVDIPESESKRLSTDPITLPPRGTAYIDAYVHLTGVALTQFRGKLARYAGFMLTAIVGRLDVTGPWGGPAPMPVQVLEDWFLADGNILAATVHSDKLGPNAEPSK